MIPSSFRIFFLAKRGFDNFMLFLVYGMDNLVEISELLLIFIRSLQHTTCCEDVLHPPDFGFGAEREETEDEEKGFKND